MHVRRVVTGHDAQGRSVFVSDAPAPRATHFIDMPGYGIAQLWCNHTPAGLGAANDRTLDNGSLIPLPGGASLLMISLAPDAVMAAPLDPARALREMSAAMPGLMACFEAQDPAMHRTPTVDYVVILEGELWLELDDGQQRLLRAGDVVIQNATRHAWRNTSGSVAKAAVFMQGLAR
ncbi:cupin domain-containing protein [Pseudomonas sp. MAFF212428]|uniref:Cupin domain-containing protein n=1 Tax=Pseudomonas brassicae TaxID=2708063 RepID=A0A6B3NWA0_9PSED|nr:cupin domain-containing protein [Pseudomonas brassicae]NER60725.1 cupin domain-containing protein [Pseudomonas brassicae]NER63867.1 cupin domain-containing protein [Pseudomonas brassicae]